VADYTTVAEVDTLASDHGLTFSGTSDEKAAAIRRAQVYIDSFSWQGQKAQGRSQSNEWPRSFAQDRDGFQIDAQEIPHEIETATGFLAIVEAATPGTLSPEVTLSQIATSETVGPISVEFAETSGTESARPVITRAMDALRPLMRKNPFALTRA